MSDVRAGAPGAVAALPAPSLDLLALNLTRRCNLACAHCYLDADTLRDGGEGELDTGEVRSLLDEIASHGDETMVVLTGGEPLARPDLELIIAHGRDLGLAMVLGTNATMLTDARVRSLRAAGLLGAGISVDSLDPERHDRFRGLPGAWRHTMRGIEACRRNGLDFQIHFSVTEQTADELDSMIEFSRTVGARVLSVFFLVCTGRGEAMTDISPERYEALLAGIVEAQARHDDLIIRSRCAPHFKRVAHQRRPDSTLNRIAGRDGDGCIAGIHYCRVGPDGTVTACPYLEDSLGNVRDTGLGPIWEGAADLARLRTPRLGGKCGVCEYRELCGGCRARARAAGLDLMDEDPACHYRPGGRELVEPRERGPDHAVRWSDEAEARLARIPGFVRRMVRQRAEAFVCELGEDEVLPDHLHELARRRFGDTGPPRVDGVSVTPPTPIDRVAKRRGQ